MSTDFSSTFDGMLRDVVRLQRETASLPRRGDVVEGKYRIEEKLGQGGMGAVFRAVHVESGKPVAIKWLLARSSRGTARLVREAQAAAQIDHPNVVNVFDVGTHEGGRFLVMELLHGESLRDRLRAGRLSPDELVRVMVPVLRGLHAAHAAGVIHRDLKPDNVFLCVGPDGTPREPKLVDFGIAKLHRGSESGRYLTEEGSHLGTPLYMSPEQRADAPNVDERADIYAAGVLMFEALTDAAPPDAAADVQGALRGAAVPHGLEAVVLRALSPSLEARHATARALLRDLERWDRDAPARAEAVDARALPPRPRATRKGLVRAAAVLAALTLGAAWVLGRSESGQAQPGTEAELSPPQDQMLAVSEPAPSATSGASSHAALPRVVPDLPVSLPKEEVFEAPQAPSAPHLTAAPRIRPVESRAGLIRRTEL